MLPTIRLSRTVLKLPGAGLDLALLTLLSLPALRPLLAPEFISTDDGLGHLVRLIELDRLWKAGELYPRLAPNLAIGYDYPTFNYYAPLALYTSEFFRLLGLSATDAIKAVLAISIVGAACSMRLFLEALLPRSGALLGAIAFCYTPYLLVDVYHRGALAESLAMALLPLVLWSTRRLAQEPSAGTVGLAGISLASLILTHNITALLAMPLVGAYWLFSLLKNGPSSSPPGPIVAAGGGLALGLALSAFFWVPALGELSFASTTNATTEFFDFHRHLQSLSRIFDPAVIYNYQTDFSLLFRIGPVQGGLAIAGFMVALARVGARREGIFWGIVMAAGIALMSTRSAFIWEHVPLLAYTQFPWRLLTVVGLASSILIGGLGSGLSWAIPRAKILNSRPRTMRFLSPATWQTALHAVWVSLLGAILVVSAIGGLKAVPFDLRAVETQPWTAQQMEHAFNSLAYSIGEFLPRWANPTVAAAPPSQSATDDVQFTVQSAGPFSLDLTATGNRPVAVTLDRFFFPGWTAQIDGQPVVTRASGAQGLLTLDVPPGTHRVQIWFAATPLRSVSAIVSGLALLTLGGLGVVSIRRGRESQSHTHDRTAASPLPSRSFGDGVLWPLGLAPSVTIAAAAAVITIGVAGNTVQGRVTRPSLPVAASFGEDVRLAGATVTGIDGDRLDLTLYWQALRRLDRDYSVDLRLVDAAGQTVGERTKQPSFGLRPTSLWQPGQLVRDDEEISLQPGRPAGEYALLVGVLDPTDGAPLRPSIVGQEDGSHVTAGRVALPARPVPILPRLDQSASASFADQAVVSSYAIRQLGSAGAELPLRPGNQAYLTLKPGERLRVDVVWRVLSDLADNDTVFVHLVDRDGRLVAQHDDWPRQRFYPTLLWIPGEVVPDAYDVRVPDDAAPGMYNLFLGLYRLVDLRRLPITNGSPGVDQLALGSIKVMPKNAITPESLTAKPRDNADFGGEVALLAHDLQTAGGEQRGTTTSAVQPGGHLALTLYWQAEQRPKRDYTTFVHVLDPAGRIVAQADSQPVAGTYPTTAWDPGEVVADQHALQLPPNVAPGPYQVIVGMYLLETGARLQLPSGADSVTLGTIDVRPSD